MDETIAAFTAHQVEELTGLGLGTLGYWVRTGMIVPRYTDDTRWLRYKYLYSFRDLVAIRTLEHLRDEGASLQKLRAVGEALREHYADPWSELGFVFWKGAVLFIDPRTGLLRDGTRPPQQAIPFDILRIADDLRGRVVALRERKPDDIGEIDNDRQILGGQAVIKGTRIPTRAIWEFHLSNYSVDAIRGEYPALTELDIRRAIAFEEQQRAKTA